MKTSASDKVRQVAKEEAQHLLDVASATATALAASTAKDITAIQSDIKEINAKLDGKYATKEELDDTNKVVNDHETRMRFIERYGFAAMGVIYVATVVIGWWVIMHVHGS